MEEINNIMQVMDNIEYGFKDENGRNIINIDFDKWNKQFDKFYYLQSPEELMKTKCGVCWDQVELERKLFKEIGIEFWTYFIYILDNDMLPSHTFLVFRLKDKYYWFEHSWGVYKGIHGYDKECELLLNVREIFVKYHNSVNEKCNIYEYQQPEYNLNCDEFYEYIKGQKKIKL